MAGNTPHRSRNLWSQGPGMVPLAPAPLLPYPQLNVPLAIEPSPAAPQEEELTSDLHFPVRLHYMLTDIHKDGLFTHIVSWQPHGRCFVVHDKKQFVEKILCLWFRQSKWASFQRQLNMYGFKRLSNGMDKGGYYHDLFLQDHPKLAQRIQRQKVKGTGPRKPAEPDQEPNFYAMASMRQVPQFRQHTLPCFRAPAPGTITLRNSLASHVLAAPDLHPRTYLMRTTAPQLPSSQEPQKQHQPSEIPSIYPTVQRVHATLTENDEEDIAAFAHLAAWCS